jgi:hypothetical protein
MKYLVDREFARRETKELQKAAQKGSVHDVDVTSLHGRSRHTNYEHGREVAFRMSKKGSGNYTPNRGMGANHISTKTLKEDAQTRAHINKYYEGINKNTYSNEKVSEPSLQDRLDAFKQKKREEKESEEYSKKLEKNRKSRDSQRSNEEKNSDEKRRSQETETIKPYKSTIPKLDIKELEKLKEEKLAEKALAKRKKAKVAAGAVAGGALGYGLGHLATRKSRKELAELKAKGNHTPAELARIKHLGRKNAFINAGATLAGAGVAGYATHKYLNK